MYKLILRLWMKGSVGRRAANLPGVQDAVVALRAFGTAVTPCGDDFQHWQMGDFIMTDADVIRFAVSRGMIAGD
ncbi:hypothetical protein ACRAWG_16950 [Methylobacterium sp. P31]